MNPKRIKVVDLFSGAGGFTLAAKKCEAELVFAVENDRHAANTYRHNFGATSTGSMNVLYEENILDLSPEVISKSHFSSAGECDLLLGGPPCQGFSSHRIKGSGINDPRNKLILTYFEFVKALRPKFFLMENVPGILWDRHKDYLKEFYQRGQSAGYHLFKPVTLDARNYGVPQARRRVFILGVVEELKDTAVNWPPQPTHGSESERLKNPKLLEWVSCMSVFRDAPVGDINNIHMNHGPELIEVFKKTPINGGSRVDSGRTLPCHEKHRGHKDVYGRIDPKIPAPTMTAGCSNPSKGRFVHPTLNHGITVRQAARIQTFPDDFVFMGGLSAAGQQIGNAVPIKLGMVLIESIKKMMGIDYSQSKNHAPIIEQAE